MNLNSYALQDMFSKKKKKSFIHPTFLSVYYMLGIIQNLGNTEMNKA